MAGMDALGAIRVFSRVAEAGSFSAVARELGEVRIVLADWEPKRLPIHALYPSRRFVSSKVRALIDFLAEEFRNDPLIAVDEYAYATSPVVAARIYQQSTRPSPMECAIIIP